MTLDLPKSFTPAQRNVYLSLKRTQFEIRHPLTGNNVCFIHDPKNIAKGRKIGLSTFQALLSAGLLELKHREYPFEIYILKEVDE